MHLIAGWKHLINRRNYFQIVFFAFIGFVLLTNTLHESYPDEFDDILGGWFLLHGKLLYTGFFTHHNPVGYFLSAFIELFTFHSFVRFRLFYSLLLFIYIVWTYLSLKKRLKIEHIPSYLITIVLYAIGATYFWGHMVLADNLAALFFLPVFVLLFLKSFYKETLTNSDLWFISILSGLAVLSALTYVYFVVIIYLFSLLKYISDHEIKYFSKESIKAVAIFAVPYTIFLLYLLLTGSLASYYYQNVYFNQTFYVYNYPVAHSGPINPIRYAIVIAQNFHNNFSSLLIFAKDFNFPFPFNISLAVADTALFIYLLFKKRFLLAIMVLLLIVYANVRTDPMTSSEKDYQSSVYILLSFFITAFGLLQLYKELNQNLEYSKKLIFSFLFLLVGVYSFYNVTFLARKYAEKTYLKFMGLNPLIYDRPLIAPIINRLVDKDDYMWIGPFEFEELFYAHGKVPSKYIILLPEFAKSPRMQAEFMNDFETNKPKIIYFDQRYSIRGYMPEKFAPFFLDYLGKNYITLFKYREGKNKYVSVLPITERIDLETKLYINKDNKNEIIKRLLENGMIRQENAQ